MIDQKVFSIEANQNKFPFTLPDLPYEDKKLQPFMSKDTFDFHHKKHHLAYVNNLNKLVEAGKNFIDRTLEEIIISSSEDKDLVGIFNNAAQVWNHSFFWHSMKENGGGQPKGKLAVMLQQNFGSFENFVSEFKASGVSQFGSGWVWLVQEGADLKIQKTSNAATPITQGAKPLICCDVWEHAYYIDHRNNRVSFLDAFINNLVNWDFAERNLDMK